MPTTLLLPLPDGLEIIAVSTTVQDLQIRVISHRVSSNCPRCSKPSQVIHSYYRRKPVELPCTAVNTAPGLPRACIATAC